jgi:hypothetical protein
LVWCFVIDPLNTGIVLGSLVNLGAANLYVVYFGQPRGAATFDEISGHAWRTVDLGPETISGDGSRYAIYVRRGASANLIIHFSGGIPVSAAGNRRSATGRWCSSPTAPETCTWGTP